MSITAHAGPIVAFQDPVTNANPELAPSLFIQGSGLLDPRPFFTYNPGQNFGALTAGWLGTNRIITLNAIPQTLSATIIAAAAHTVAATPMTLASTTTAGRAVSVSIPRSDTGVLVTGLLELDPPIKSVTATVASGSNVMSVTAIAVTTCHYQLNVGDLIVSGTSIPTGTTIVAFGTGGGGLGTYILSNAATAAISGGTLVFSGNGMPGALIPLGAAGTIQLWNPYALISRGVNIVCNSASGAGGTFTVRGFDIYGYPMTEVITSVPASATTTSGLKAWKYILSVTPNTTDATYTYSVGTQDIIGFPIRSDNFTVGIDFDTVIMSNNATIAATTGYLAAVPTTATATTGDVRGTFALQTASNGTLSVIFQQSPKVGSLTSAAGLFGVTQYADF